MTLIPTTYNADTLGIRPDLIKRPISSWAELLNPEFKGKAAILNIPRSASWTRRWWSRPWACTSTATRAT
jgi:ABC-type Fe3+ transport system substrate-binding protein